MTVSGLNYIFIHGTHLNRMLVLFVQYAMLDL